MIIQKKGKENQLTNISSTMDSEISSFDYLQTRKGVMFTLSKCNFQTSDPEFWLKQISGVWPDANIYNGLRPFSQQTCDMSYCSRKSTGKIGNINNVAVPLKLRLVTLSKYHKKVSQYILTVTVQDSSSDNSC